MCKSVAEGGQRCAAHTRKKYAATMPSDGRIFDEAAAEYASTAEGQEILSRDAQDAADVGDYELEARLLTAMERGHSRRDANSETAAVLDARERARDTSAPLLETPRQTVDVVTGGGVPMRVKVVEPGESYGQNGRLVTDRPLVEFYDSRSESLDHPDGQFITRYPVAALTGGVRGTALSLAGHDPEWVVDADNMTRICGWLQNR